MTKLSLRKRLIAWLGKSKATSIMVGSFINSEGERCVAISLQDGFKESCAGLSPEGARATARQLNEWADWAEAGRSQRQWQLILDAAIRTASKFTENAPSEGS